MHSPWFLKTKFSPIIIHLSHFQFKDRYTFCSDSHMTFSLEFYTYFPKVLLWYFSWCILFKNITASNTVIWALNQTPIGPINRYLFHSSKLLQYCIFNHDSIKKPENDCSITEKTIQMHKDKDTLSITHFDWFTWRTDATKYWRSTKLRLKSLLKWR